MKIKFNFYTCIYLIYSVVSVLCIIAVLLFYKSMNIPLILFELFNFDIAKFLVIFAFLIIFIIFLIVNFIFSLKSIKQDSPNNIDTLVKKGIWVLPLIFLFIIQLALAVPIALTHSKNLQQDELCSISKFDELSNKNIEVRNDYSYQENFLGKVVNLKEDAVIPDTTEDNGHWINGNSLIFSCYYRQSDYKTLLNKTEKFSVDLFEKNKVENDGYTFYYETENDYISYSLRIENENEYFVSAFLASGDKAICDYSKEQFISDSLSNYQKWKSE